MKNPVLQALAIVIVLLAFGAGIGMYSSSYYTNQLEAAPNIEGLLWPDGKQLRPFASIDHRGEVFGLNSFKDKWSFIFFGYTHCPDICPVTLSVMNQVNDKLVEFEDKENLQFVFMTVDPERDTQEKLSEYIEYFNSDFIGLGGNMTQVESLTRQIGVAHILNEKEPDGSYLVDHSASIFLIDPEGKLSAIFSAPHEPGEISQRFQSIHEFLSQRS